MSIAGVLAFSGGIGGFDILGSTEEKAVDQATPPTDRGEDNGPDSDTDTMLSGGNYVDHMLGSAEDDLVYLDAGDDFYDGKQREADAGDDTIHGEDGNDTIRDSRGNHILYGEKGRDILNAVDQVDYIGADTLIDGTGKDILQGDIDMALAINLRIGRIILLIP